MNDYKRFISYIYNYEEKIKKNNIGYARVEIKEKQCKITIHIEVKSILNGNLKIYGFLRKEVNIMGIPLAALTLKNGKGDCQIYTQTDRVGDSAHDFTELSGILLYYNDNKYFGTEWDDKPLVFKQLLLEEKRKEVKEEKQEAAQKQEIAQEQKDVRKQEAVQRQENVRGQEAVQRRENVQKEEASLRREPVQEQRELLREMQENAYKEEILNVAEIKKEEAARTENIAAEGENREELSEFNLEFMPYTLEELFERFAYTVTQDFMLHGYYRFGHLGVMKKKERYILGVPGIFCKQEEEIARNEGFQNFIPKSNRALQYGDFGYWYKSTEYLK